MEEALGTTGCGPVTGQRCALSLRCRPQLSTTRPAQETRPSLGTHRLTHTHPTPSGSCSPEKLLATRCPAQPPISCLKCGDK